MSHDHDDDELLEPAAGEGDEPTVLQPWAAAMAAAIDRDIVRYAPVPDLADVLARARASDPTSVPDAWDELVRADHEVLSLAEARALSQGAPDPMVAAFAAALRDDVEAGLHERTLAAIPEAPAPSRRLRGLAVAVMALAAAMVLAWLAPRLLGHNDPTVQDPGMGVPSAAPSVAPTPVEQTWESGRPPAPAPAPPVPASAVTPAPEAPAPLPSAVTPAPAPPSTPSVATGRKPGLDLDAIERDALAAWRSGDLATAERLLLRIAHAGRNTRAELAYADLFAIARQRRGADGQVDMWRAYLDRFPRGRFADDARAGLCRRAEDPAAARACWERYLERHPSGAHAAEARRWERPPSP